MQLLQQKDMQRLRQELYACPEGNKAGNLQGLLDQCQEKDRIQEQEI